MITRADFLELAPRLRYPTLPVAVAIGYLGASKLGLLAAVAQKVVSSAWPPSGVALAALLLLGLRYWPGIAMGAFLLNWTASVPVAGAAGIALGNTLEAVSAVWLLRRVADFRPSLDRFRDVVALVTLGALASTTVSATIGIASLWASGVVGRDALSHLWFVWWSGDALGDVLVAPLLLTWARATRPPARCPGAAALAGPADRVTAAQSYYVRVRRVPGRGVGRRAVRPARQRHGHGVDRRFDDLAHPAWTRAVR